LDEISKISYFLQEIAEDIISSTKPDSGEI